MTRWLSFSRLPSSTLRLSLPMGGTLALAVVLVLAAAVVSEIALRVPAVQSILPAPSVHSQHRDFEVKLQRLREMGQVDCVFLGSSVAARGLSPGDFEQAYQAASGQAISCFNFGVNGAGEYTGVILADYVMKAYKPSLLVFGISPRLGNGEGAGTVAGLPWAQYQQGVFSLQGWLLEHVAIYRYSRAIASALFGTLDLGPDRKVRDDGFYPTYEPMTFPLSPAEIQRVERSPYAVSDAWLSRLDEMLAFHRPPQTRVVIVEMPVHRVALDDYPDMLTDYEESMAMVDARAEAQGVPFFPTSRLAIVPDDTDWRDFNHFNASGAAVFSRWLGERVAEADQQGLLAAPAG